MFSSMTEMIPQQTIVVAGDDNACIKSDVMCSSGAEKLESDLTQDKSDRGKDEAEIVVIRFAKHDPENPFDWRPAKKWLVVTVAQLYSASTAINATSYDSGAPSMQSTIPCSALAATSGLTSYLVLCGIAPLLLAPISEQFGRRGMMMASAVVFMLCYIPVAVAKEIWVIILFRGVQGAAASAGNSLVGGVVADVFAADTRGLPMTMFSFFVLAGQGVGAVIFGWVDMKLGFRWIAWINMIIAFVLTFTMYFLLVETRGSKILDDRARNLTKQTGVLHVADTESGGSSALMGQQTVGILDLLRTTASRPIVFLVTEPVVAALATWAALLWGVVFILYSAVPLIYAQYNFSYGQTGTTFVTVIIGAFFGVFLARWQDRLYQRDGAKTALGRAPPESRLYAACIGGLIVPISLFWFAWSGRPGVHWIVPTIALTFFNFGIFPIYLATFSYLADSYEQYGSSAIAAQSFLRNIFGGTFPLLTIPMYENLGYPEASTLLGALACAFSVLPFLLMAYGPQIRSRGRVAKQIARQQEIRAAEAARDAEEKVEV
ncbi:MFS general substrate transporter [Athelia psychrophila]|uniref:MFS general substrate transporter n=1 Tax=Athelia psychrophila TaxID=1759441 RepID=A0A166BPG0_9AGAM|nr:MFS general substrate transporter [Fibularhizoctonia sp. CBS 109695]